MSECFSYLHSGLKRVRFVIFRGLLIIPIIILLLLSNLAIAQVEGPWRFWESADSIANPRLVARSDSVVDMFFQTGTDIWHLTANVLTGEILTEAQAFPALQLPYTMRRLKDVVYADSGWVAVTYDETGTYNRTTIFEGNDSVSFVMEVDSAANYPTWEWGSGSVNSSLDLFAGSDGYIYLGWVDWWSTGAPWYEGGWGVGILRFPLFEHQVETLVNDQLFNDYLDKLSLIKLSGDTLVFIGDAEVFYHCLNRVQVTIPTQPEYCFESWNGFDNLEDNYLTNSIAWLVTDSLELVLSSAGEWQLGHFDPRLIKYNRITDERSVLDSLHFEPLGTVTNNNFGIAWVSNENNGLILHRWDTTGTEAVVSGVFYWPEGDYHPLEADLAMTDNGKIIALCSEQNVAQTQYRLQLIGTEWESPLKVKDSQFHLLPQKMELDIYPNPFNPSTTISFDLDRESFVKLVVFDITGREVKVLVNERKNAGEHRVQFDGSELSSGIYFARMELRPPFDSPPINRWGENSPSARTVKLVLLK